MLPEWAYYCMGVKEGLNMLVFVELSFVRCKMAQENGIPFSRIFCCGRFHQFVLIVISLYKFEKDETQGLHYTDCSFSLCKWGFSEPFGA